MSERGDKAAARLRALNKRAKPASRAPKQRVVRVLAIPKGKDRDGKGTQLGDDWLLASLGFSEELGAQIYLTTDQLKGDEVPSWLNDPARMATILAAAINDGHLEGVDGTREWPNG